MTLKYDTVVNGKILKAGETLDLEGLGMTPTEAKDWKDFYWFKIA